MTDEHKAALAQGRTEGRAVRNYMAALASQTPGRRGRKAKGVAELEEALRNAKDPMERLKLRPLLREAQEAESADSVDMDDLESQFTKVVASYSERLGLTYADWREEGVSAAVLKAAGMKRGS
jgi:hypothetical protein